MPRAQLTLGGAEMRACPLDLKLLRWLLAERAWWRGAEGRLQERTREEVCVSLKSEKLVQSELDGWSIGERTSCEPWPRSRVAREAEAGAAAFRRCHGVARSCTAIHTIIISASSCTLVAYI
jgi:hypothetical protein